MAGCARLRVINWTKTFIDSICLFKYRLSAGEGFSVRSGKAVSYAFASTIFTIGRSLISGRGFRRGIASQQGQSARNDHKR